MPGAYAEGAGLRRWRMTTPRPEVPPTTMVGVRSGGIRASRPAARVHVDVEDRGGGGVAGSSVAFMRFLGAFDMSLLKQRAQSRG